MKTLKKEQEKELSKVNLFNLLYGTGFETHEFGQDWNGITLAEHIKQSNWTPPEQKPEIYGNVTRVSPNGMNRDIKFHIVSNGRIANITWLMSWILDEREPKQNKYNEHVIRVNGAGMDMVFHCIYTLGSIMFEDMDMDRAGYMFNHNSI